MLSLPKVKRLTAYFSDDLGQHIVPGVGIGVLRPGREIQFPLFFHHAHDIGERKYIVKPPSCSMQGLRPVT